LGCVVGGLVSAALALAWLIWVQPAAGATSAWSAPLNLSQSSADSAGPAVALASGRLHVVWEESSRLYHRYQTDAGWSAVATIGSGSEPALAAGGDGRLHLVYVDVFGGNAEALYRSWAGAGWTAAVNISRTTAPSATPGIAIATNGRRHVVWVEDALADPWVFYAESSDGLLWESSPLLDAFGTNPQVVVDASNRPHVLWAEPYSFDDPLDLFYSRWTGNEWTLPEDVSDTPTASSSAGSLALAPDGTPWAAWQEEVSGQFQVWTSSRSTAGWGAPSVLAQPVLWPLARRPGQAGTGANADVIEPALAVGDRLAQVWVAGDTLRARWLVNGTWGAAEDVWADAGGISQPALAVGTDGEMWVAWIGAGPTGADDVFVSERGSSAESRVYLPLSLR
jgi:hypothetical protein